MNSREETLKELGLPNLPPSELNEWFDKNAVKLESRQTKRAQQIKTLETQVKDLTRLLDITTNALEKAAKLMGVLSPDTAQRFSDVLRLVDEQKHKALNQPKSN